jgi:hypothetical protein
MERRPVRFSTMLLAVMLSPAMLQSSDCNAPTGNTALSLLELDASGENRVIGFVSSQRVYDVWAPLGDDLVTVRAVTEDPAAVLSASYVGVTLPMGTGSGEVDFTVSLGMSGILVHVDSPGGNFRSYLLNVTHGDAPPCLTCGDGDDCTNDICDPLDGICTNVAVDDFSVCDLAGTPGACVAGACLASQTKTVPVACTNGVLDSQNSSPYALTVATTPVQGGASPQPFTAHFQGVGTFPRFFLDAAVAVVPGGIRSATIEAFSSTVSVRSGATGSDVELGPDLAAIVPGPTRFCLYPFTTVCTVDSDCLVPPCQPPTLIIDLPISEDCGPGGFCEGIGRGFADGVAAQCNLTDPPEFCIAGDLAVSLAGPPGVYTPDSSGAVLFGWAEDPVTVTCPDADPRCASSGGTIPDNSLAVPPSTFGDPIGDPSSVGPNGARLNFAGALFVARQCTLAEPGGVCAGQTDLACLTHSECGGSGPCDLTVADVAMPSPDAAHIYVAIGEPDAVSCGAADCNDGDPCSVDSCGAGDVCIHTPVSDGAACVSGGLPGGCLSGACVSACALLNCNDGQACTGDSCLGLTGKCENIALADLSGCDFGGNAGLCTGGTCVGACDLTDCSDGDDCTTDNCDPVTGTCSNVTAPDDTGCDFGGGLPGLCSSGICQDAQLCNGVNCDDGNICTDDSCNPFDGLCVNDASPATTMCTYMGLPGLCSLSTCALACDVLDCDDTDDCTDDFCDPFVGTCSNTVSTDGAVCDSGLGQCQAGACQPTAPVFTSQTKGIPLECRSFFSGSSPLPPVVLPYDLTVATTPIVGGADPRAFTAEFSGIVRYQESALDALQTAIPSGTQGVRISFSRWIVSVVSGTQGPDTEVSLDLAGTPHTLRRFCIYPNSQECVVDADCPVTACGGPVPVVDIPTSADCAPSGVCDALGKTGPGSQCEANGFCVTGDLPMAVGVETATYVPDASGVVVFDWNAEPGSFFFNGEAGGVFQSVFCVTTDPPESALVYFPIDASAPVSCNGLDCNDGSDCTTDSCTLPGGTCANTALADGALCDFGGLPGSCASGTCIAVCDATDCDDANPCTAESCNATNGLCDRTILDGQNCDLSGTAGVCVGSACLAICDVVGCDDANECTADLCDLPTGACTNPVATDGSFCNFGSLPGVCLSGVCEDAMLCDGVNCDDGTVCTDDSCDPQTGLCDYDPVPSSVSCNFGSLPGACVDGTCESECAVVDCGDGDDCTDDVCDPIDATCSNNTSPDDTLCDAGYGRCQTGICDPIPANEWTTQSQVVTVACTNGVSAPPQEVMPYELTVRATSIDGGASPQPFTAEFGGVALFPELLVSAAQGAVPGGVRSAIIEGLKATTSVRSGATGPDVELGPDLAAIVPGPTQFCLYPPTTVCTVDTDCIVSPCKPPDLVIDLPLAEDCGPGGFCEGIGQGFADGPTAQCNITGPPEFCVSGDLRIPLGVDARIYTPDASGSVLFGWVDQNVPGVVTCPAAAPDCQESYMPDGCYDLPPAIYGDPINNPSSIGPLGMRLNISGALFVSVECVGATAGGICASGEGCIVDADCATAPCTRTPNVACPTQDAGLISFPIN